MLIFALFVTSACAVVIPNNGSSVSPSISPSPLTTFAKAPCLTALGQYCGRPEDPYYPLTGYLASSYLNPYASGSDTASDLPVRSSCSAVWESSLAAWEKTAPITYGPMSAMTTLGDVIPAQTSAAFFSDAFSFTAKTPCCAGCEIFGGDISIYFWPAKKNHSITNGPPVTSLLVDKANNFTFTSPSIYLVIATAFATNYCGTMGTPIVNTTLAFAPGELSTGSAYGYPLDLYPTPPPLPLEFSSYVAATWGTYPICEDIITTITQEASDTNSYFGTHPGITTVVPVWGMGYTYTITPGEWIVTYNPCSPELSIPSTMYSLDPLWTKCGMGIRGLYDPPYSLSAGNGLEPSTIAAPVAAPTTSIPVAVPDFTSSPAVAAPTISSVTPRVTSTSDLPPVPTPTPAGPSSQIPPAGQNSAPAASPASLEPPIGPPSSQSDPSDPATSIIPAAPLSSSPPKSPGLITLGSTTVTANSPSALVIDSQTLTAGSAITYSGTILSLATDGASLIVGGTSIANPVTTYLVGSQTLSAGGSAVTLLGTTYSLQPGGSSVIINGQTRPILSALNTPEFIVASQTLVAGGAPITVSGKIVSLEAGASSIVVGASTEPLSQFLGSSTSTVNGLGQIIATIGGFGKATPVTSSPNTLSTGFVYNGTVFTGGAIRRENGIWVLGLGVGVGLLASRWAS